jgi:hypothetical protein
LLQSDGKSEVAPAPFHQRWSDILLNGVGHTAIQGFRESAKTNYTLRAYLLYAIQFPDTARDYIVLIKNNDTLAAAGLREIAREANSNPVISANTVRIVEQSGNVYSVDRVSADTGETINVRIEAYGKGASIRGLANRDRRPKICIIDDPQDNEDSKSETIQASDWDWFLSDVMFLGQSTRIFLIGNNLGDRSIIERVFNNAGSLGFRVERIPILTPTGESAWPEKFTVARIEQEKKSYMELGKLDIWLRERMCQSVSEETRIFNRTDYRYFTAALARKISFSGCNRFATLDPASSTDITSCYRAIVVNAVNEDNYWYIPVIEYGRWDSAELINQIFSVVSDWQIKDFGIEIGMFKQVIEPFIYKEMSKRNIYFNILPIEHAKKGSKLERIKMLQPRFKAHTIWFPDNSPTWLVELETELQGVTRDSIKSLYADLMDALAMQEQIAVRPIFSTSNNPGDRRDLPREAVAEFALT